MLVQMFAISIIRMDSEIVKKIFEHNIMQDIPMKPCTIIIYKTFDYTFFTHIYAHRSNIEIKPRTMLNNDHCQYGAVRVRARGKKYSQRNQISL